MFKDITDRFSKEVWSQDVHKLSRSRQIAVYWVRLFDLLIQDLMDGYLSQRAASLAYTSILSVVPLLAFSFALLKGFGFQNKFEPLLLDIFSSMGPQGAAMSGDIIDFMNNVRAGVLGGIGLALLLLTVLSLTRKVETAFNFVWRVRESRSLTKGFAHYLGILMIGPLLLVVVAGVTASFSNQAVVNHLIGGAAAGMLVFVVAKAISLLIIVRHVHLPLHGRALHPRAAPLGGHGRVAGRRAVGAHPLGVHHPVRQYLDAHHRLCRLRHPTHDLLRPGCM